MNLSEKEKAALARWRGRLHVSYQDLVEIHRICEKANVEYDEIIRFSLYINWRIIYIDENTIERYNLAKQNDSNLLNKIEEFMQKCEENNKKRIEDFRKRHALRMKEDAEKE